MSQLSETSTPASEPLLGEALVIAAEDLRGELGGIYEVEAARDYLQEIERLNVAPWRYERNWLFFARYEDIGAALIAGRNLEIARLLEGVLRCDNGSDLRIVDADPSLRSNSDWISIGWLRILRGDWTPLPPYPTAGRLPVTDSGEIVAPLLDLAAERDIEGVAALVNEVAGRHESGHPSILAAGLRRILPPPLPEELRDPGLFYVGPNGELRGRRLDPDLLTLTLDAYPLAEVRVLEPQTWSDPAGGSWSVIVESLACGHRRAASRSSWDPAGARRCARCPRREMEERR